MKRLGLFLAAGLLALVAACGSDDTATLDDDGSGASGTNGGSGPGGSGASGPGGSGGMAAVCGNGVVELEEGCDDGNQDTSDSCPDGPGATCQPAGCGDGFVWSSDGGAETCDDGNQDTSDSCPDGAMGTCQTAGCGDGFVWSSDGGTETCDDGNDNLRDDCPDGAMGSCLAASCDDGFLHDQGSGEELAVDCGGTSCLGCGDALLLSEVVVTPTGGEYVEIHNPTGEAVKLDRIYLADYAEYYLVTQGTGSPAASDFRVKFPAGATIAAGDHLTVSLHAASDFEAEYGELPDYDFDMNDGGAPVMEGDIGSTAGLTNGSEMLVLFFWDGASDLVQDVDYAVWGDTDSAMDKTGVTVGASTYQADVAPGSQSVGAEPAAGESLARCDMSEGSETQTSGNGFSGANESSEDVASTWEILSARTPGQSCLMYASNRDDHLLYSVKSNDFTVQGVTPVLMMNQNIDGILGLSKHPLTSTLYGIAKLGTARHLITIDPSAGTATDVGDLGAKFAGIAFDAAGALYGVTGDGASPPETLFTIDTMNASTTQVVALGNGGAGETIAFNPADGLLYHFSGTTGSPAFESIDPSGPTITPISYTGTPPDEAFGCAYTDGGFVCVDINEDMWRIFPDGSTSSTSTPLGNGTRGLVFQ